MLRRIVRNLWRRGIGSCVSQLKRELSPWLEFGLIPANLSDPSKRYFALTFPSATASSGLSRWSARAHNRESGR
jgi:hypothetical protein